MPYTRYRRLSLWTILLLGPMLRTLVPGDGLFQYGYMFIPAAMFAHWLFVYVYVRRTAFASAGFWSMSTLAHTAYLAFFILQLESDRGQAWPVIDWLHFRVLGLGETPWFTSLTVQHPFWNAWNITLFGVLTVLYVALFVVPYAIPRKAVRERLARRYRSRTKRPVQPEAKREQ